MYMCIRYVLMNFLLSVLFLLSSDLPWSCLHVHVLALFNYDVELNYCTFSAFRKSFKLLYMHVYMYTRCYMKHYTCIML